MMHKYSKRQIAEAIKYWQNKLSESEAMMDIADGVWTCSARDLIYADADKLDKSVKVCEIPDRHLDILNADDMKIIARQNSRSDCRFVAYYIDDYEGPWRQAYSEIDSQYAFQQYTNPAEFDADEFDQEFTDEFQTYEDWIQHLSDERKTRLEKILEQSNEMPYDQLPVHVNNDGIAYAFVGWRV